MATKKPAVKKRGVGRQTKLTPERQEKILTAIRAGNFACVAARSAGIEERTFYRWLERGEQETTGIYCQFRQAVKDAEAHAEIRGVARIAKASETQWQAAAWHLERKHYQRWGRKDTMRIGGDPDGVPVQVDDPYSRVTGRIAELAERRRSESGAEGPDETGDGGA